MVESTDQQALTITGDQAVDWLIRSALPMFCELVDLREHAEWLRHLDPYPGRVGDSASSGWGAAYPRVTAIEDRVRQAYCELIRDAAAAGRPLNIAELPVLDPDTQAEVRRIAAFAREVLLPSPLGWDAYRVLSMISRLVGHAGHFYCLDDETSETLEQAWQDIWTSISDRGRLNRLEHA